MTFGEFVGFVAAVIGGAFGVVQSVRTIRTRSVAGWSMLTWFSGCVNSGMWIMFGVNTGAPQQLVANIPWLIMGVVVGLGFAKSGRFNAAVGCSVPVLMLVVGWTVVSVTKAVVGSLGLLLGVIRAVPQLRASRTADDMTGVSGVAWVLSVVSGACWITYGLAEGNAQVLIASVPMWLLTVWTTHSIVVRKRQLSSVLAVAA